VDFQVGFPHVCAVLRTIRRNGQQDSRVEYRVHETMNDFPQSVTLELRFGRRLSAVRWSQVLHTEQVFVRDSYDGLIALPVHPNRVQV